jgi:membrane-associated phospholipid phosphatase
VLAGAAIGLSYGLVRSGRSALLDDAVAGLVRRPLGAQADRVIAAATDVGSVFGLAGTAATLAATGRRGAAVDVVVSGSMAWCAAQAVKPLLDRPRPYEQGEADRLVAIPAGTSWPSGHAAVAAAMATSLADHGGRAASAVGTGMVGFVSASRVYVGVHHATDPLAGVGIGVLCASAWRGVRGLVRRVRSANARTRLVWSLSTAAVLRRLRRS